MTASNKNIFEETKLGQAQDFGLLKKLYPYVKPYRNLFTYTFIIIILITGLELTIPYITKVVIDRYIVPENSIRLKKGTQMRYLSCDLADPEISKIVSAGYENERIRKLTKKVKDRPYDNGPGTLIDRMKTKVPQRAFDEFTQSLKDTYKPSQTESSHGYPDPNKDGRSISVYVNEIVQHLSDKQRIYKKTEPKQQTLF